MKYLLFHLGAELPHPQVKRPFVNVSEILVPAIGRRFFSNIAKHLREFLFSRHQDVGVAAIKAAKRANFNSGLARMVNPFTRCMTRNAPLRPAWLDRIATVFRRAWRHSARTYEAYCPCRF